MVGERAIEGIAFDLGNTLIPINYGKCFRMFGQEVGLPAYDIDRIFGEMIDSLERGLYPVSGGSTPISIGYPDSLFVKAEKAGIELHASFCQRVTEARKRRVCPPLDHEESLSYERFLEIFNDVPHSFEYDRLDFVRRLGERYKIVFVSNTNPISLYFLKTIKPYSEFFSLAPVVASHEVGARKPESAMWECVIEVLGVDPARSVFVDDVAAFVEGWLAYWREKGISSHGVVCRSYNFYATMRELEEMGISWGME